MGKLMNCVEKMFLFHVLYGFDCLFRCINVWINFGNEFGVKRIKFRVFRLKIVDSRKGKHQKQGYCSGASRTGDNCCVGRYVASATIGVPGRRPETANHVFVVRVFGGPIRAF